MRQLDLFASIFEKPSEDYIPAEAENVAENVLESPRAAAPAFSGNTLRSERQSNLSSFPNDNDESNTAGQPTPPPDILHPSASLFPSLFDTIPETSVAAEETIEIVVSQTEIETDTIPAAVAVPNSESTNAGKVVTTTAREEVMVSLVAVQPPAPDTVRMTGRKIVSAQVSKKQKAPELERNGAVVFDDGKISVKIKAKSPFPAPVVKAKKEKEKKIPQKRGRKSFKEIDAEVDLVEIPEDDLLFQKQYYPISEVARWFRVNTSLLRFWENEFDVLKPRKNRKGDRLFRPEDVKNLQLIYQLLRQRKYTIEGAKEYIKTNKKKADIQLHLTNTLQKFKSFLLDMKANLQ